MPKTITYKQLQNHYACESQLKLFKREFGESLDLSDEKETEALIDAYAGDFEIPWLAEALLPSWIYIQYIDAVHEISKVHRAKSIAVGIKLFGDTALSVEAKEKLLKENEDSRTQFRRMAAKVFVRFYLELQEPVSEIE
jgi:hypothetical protein